MKKIEIKGKKIPNMRNSQEREAYGQKRTVRLPSPTEEDTILSHVTTDHPKNLTFKYKNTHIITANKDN